MIEILQSKIAEYWYKRVANTIGISIGTLFRIINNQSAQFNKTVLNKLYKYINRDKDTRYYEHLGNRIRQTFDVWLYIRTERLKKNLSINKMSDETKLSEKTILRIESNQTNPTEYTLNQICDYLEIDINHRRVLILYTQSFRLLNKILWQ